MPHRQLGRPAAPFFGAAYEQPFVADLLPRTLDAARREIFVEYADADLPSDRLILGNRLTLNDRVAVHAAMFRRGAQYVNRRRYLSHKNSPC